MSIRHHENNHETLPELLSWYKTSTYYEAYKDKSVDMLAFNEENNLPLEYAEILKRKLREF